LVRMLCDGRLQAGAHSIYWDGRNDAGSPAGSGVYFIRVTGGESSQTRQIALVR
jgi:flagellar hook assembly protein FlgD